MTKPALPRFKRSLQYLARLYETETDTILKTVLAQRMPAEASDIIASGALTPAGLAWEIPDDDGEWREIREWEPGVFAWFSMAEGIVEVTEEQQRQYRYDRQWLVNTLCSLLNLTGERTTIVPNRLVWLGNLSVDGQPYQILLSRHLTSMEGFREVYLGMQNWQGLGKGVVLTVAEPYQPLLPLPGGYPVVPIMSLLQEAEDCLFDNSRLKTLLKQTFTPDGNNEISFEDYGSSAQLAAEGRSTWSINGRQRCKVARMIYEAWMIGNRGVSNDQLREEGISYTHPKNCYNKGSEWEQYIHFENQIWSLKAKPRPRIKRKDPVQ